MRLRGIVFAVAAILLTGAAQAAPAGTAVGVDPAASSSVGTVTKTLVVGSDVGMGDKIVTGASGQVQLVFTDETHLVVGPNSSLVIESYLLRGDKLASKFAVNALSGTFRFITGKSDHSAYHIATPTGTIGIRGTAFDFNVGTTTTVALFRGAVELCTLDPRQPHCVVLDHQCQAGEIQQQQSTIYGHWQAIDDGLRDKFHYILSQKPLLPDFHVDESRQCFRNVNPSPGGVSVPMTGGTFESTEPLCEGYPCSPG